MNLCALFICTGAGACWPRWPARIGCPRSLNRSVPRLPSLPRLTVWFAPGDWYGNNSLLVFCGRRRRTQQPFWVQGTDASDIAKPDSWG